MKFYRPFNPSIRLWSSGVCQPINPNNVAGGWTYQSIQATCRLRDTDQLLQQCRVGIWQSSYPSYLGLKCRRCNESKHGVMTIEPGCATGARNARWIPHTFVLFWFCCYLKAASRPCFFWGSIKCMALTPVVWVNHKRFQPKRWDGNSQTPSYWHTAACKGHL